MSDPQYRSFRNNLPSLVILSGSYLICSSLHSRLFLPASGVTAEDCSFRLRHRATFITAFSGIMLLILHGISALKILVILGLNFWLIRVQKSGAAAKAWPAILIVGNMAILFLNEQYDGYRFGGLGSFFEVLVSNTSIAHGVLYVATNVSI